MKLTKQSINQYRKIIADVPKGATHVTMCNRRDYLKARHAFFDVWHKDKLKWIYTIDVEFDKSKSLDNIRTIVAQYDENQRLRDLLREASVEIEADINQRYTGLLNVPHERECTRRDFESDMDIVYRIRGGT